MKRFVYLLVLVIAGTIKLYAHGPKNPLNINLPNNHFFIENKGQWHEDVLFKINLPHHTVWITKYGLMYDIYDFEKTSKQNENDPLYQPDIIKHGHAYKMIYESRNINPKYEGKNKVAAYFNYFIGNDPKKHTSNVPAFKEVMVYDIYKGINVRYYIENHFLRFDFIVSPQADLSQINLKFEGLHNSKINNQGDSISLNTRFGNIFITDMKVFQENKSIEARFTKKSNNSFSINIQNYNPNLPMIIDPVNIVWSTFIGGDNGNEYAYDMVVDGNKNVYVTGITYSNDYPTTTGVYDNTYNYGGDVFVSKLDPNATTLLFSTFVGGSSYEYGYGIALDATGNIYVTGMLDSPSYPTTPGAMSTSKAGSLEGFAFKLDNNGSNLLYSTFIGGGAQDECYDILVDNFGNAYITGYTKSNSFPHSTSGVFQTSKNPGEDAFVIEINPTGSGFVYSTFIGGSDDDRGYSIKRDNNGDIYIVGHTKSNNFPVSSGCFQNTISGKKDVFIFKLSSNFSSRIFSTYVGGSDDDQVSYNSLDIDNNGNVYVTGYTTSSNFPTTTGAYQTTISSTSEETFVIKVNNNGSSLIYSTLIGGTGTDYGHSIKVMSDGSAFITGHTASTDFDVTSDAYQTTFQSVRDAFVTWLNPSGTSLLFSSYLGGSDEDNGYALCVDNNLDVYIAGHTLSSNYPTTPSVFQTIKKNLRDVFVTKLCFRPSVEILTPSQWLQIVDYGSPINTVQYVVYLSSGITVTGLPPGVTATISGNTITISGTPSNFGPYTYTIKAYNHCDTTFYEGYINIRENNLESCNVSNTFDFCWGGNGELKTSTNINTGMKYWWSQSSPATLNNINFGGGSLVVCSGNLTINSGNANSGTIIIMPSATLQLNYSTFNNFTIYNYGTLIFLNNNVSFQPVTLYNNPYGTVTFTNNLTLNNSSQIINKSNITVKGNMIIQTSSAPALCKSNCALTQVNNQFTNNTPNSVVASSGCECLYLLGNITLNNNLSNTPELHVCDAPGGTQSGGGTWGSATYHPNCTSCSSALPIELSEFTANPRDNYVELYWKTATQINNDYFVVEKSKDAQNWQQLVIVKGAGTSYTTLEYLEIDPQPYEGINYYRLKQVDFDGNYSYSQIVAVKFSKQIATGGEPVLFPNPIAAGETLNIQFPANYMEVLVVLRDMMGKEVFSKVIVFEENNLLYAIPLDKELPSGMYLVIASSHRNTLFSKKIIIK